MFLDVTIFIVIVLMNCTLSPAVIVQSYQVMDALSVFLLYFRIITLPASFVLNVINRVPHKLVFNILISFYKMW